MRKAITVYGLTIMAIIVASVAISLLYNGNYVGTSGETSTGIIAAIGKEVAFEDEDTTQSRVGPELEGIAASTDAAVLECNQLVVQGKETPITELFTAATEDGTPITVNILHIQNAAGQEVLNKSEAILCDGILTMNTAGAYKFTVCSSNRAKTKVFDVYVIPNNTEDAPEESEVE